MLYTRMLQEKPVKGYLPSASESVPAIFLRPISGKKCTVTLQEKEAFLWVPLQESWKPNTIFCEKRVIPRPKLLMKLWRNCHRVFSPLLQKTVWIGCMPIAQQQPREVLSTGKTGFAMLLLPYLTNCMKALPAAMKPG